MSRPTDFLESAGFAEIFRCFICYGALSDAQLCPCCSKMCCHACITRWLTEHRCQCPYCRAPLRPTQLVPCRFVNEMHSEIERLVTKVQQAKEDICELHPNMVLNYFCTTCQTCCCSDCAMFDGTHRDHSFEKLDAVYDRHSTTVRQRMQELGERLEHLQGLLENADVIIQSLTAEKDYCGAELMHKVEMLSQKLEADLHHCLQNLEGQKATIRDEMEVLQSMTDELQRHLTGTPKAALVRKAATLCDMLECLRLKPIADYRIIPPVISFQSGIAPPWSSATFRIERYSQRCSTEEVLYSQPLQIYASFWRLKVYPNGNGIAQGNFLSVFLQLLAGAPQTAPFEYRVEMVNPTDGAFTVARQFTSDFQVGECWGYNRFYQLEALRREGFLGAEDVLVLHYKVRAPTYHQHCADMQRYIGQLEAARDMETASDVVGTADEVREEVARPPSPEAAHTNTELVLDDTVGLSLLEQSLCGAVCSSSEELPPSRQGWGLRAGIGTMPGELQGCDIPVRRAASGGAQRPQGSTASQSSGQKSPTSAGVHGQRSSPMSSHPPWDMCWAESQHRHSTGSPNCLLFAAGVEGTQRGEQPRPQLELEEPHATLALEALRTGAAEAESVPVPPSNAMPLGRRKPTSNRDRSRGSSTSSTSSLDSRYAVDDCGLDSELDSGADSTEEGEAPTRFCCAAAGLVPPPPPPDLHL
eukprot:GGOE01044993.1.p1 GENE.GGOE01044993.1~~GGOE01044993.1.p1  ORF type:complete len:700 (-),score=194.30 GGOE01044993.1:198-2297(-)